MAGEGGRELDHCGGALPPRPMDRCIPESGRGLRDRPGRRTEGPESAAQGWAPRRCPIRPRGWRDREAKDRELLAVPWPQGPQTHSQSRRSERPRETGQGSGRSHGGLHPGRRAGSETDPPSPRTPEPRRDARVTRPSAVAAGTERQRSRGKTRSVPARLSFACVMLGVWWAAPGPSGDEATRQKAHARTTTGTPRLRGHQIPGPSTQTWKQLRVSVGGEGAVGPATRHEQRDLKRVRGNPRAGSRLDTRS